MPPVCTVTNSRVSAHQQESIFVQPGRYAGAGLRAVHLDPPPANPRRGLLDARGNRLAAAGSSSRSASRSSDFSRADEQILTRNSAPASRSSEVAGVERSGSKARWWTLMPMPTTAKSAEPRKSSTPPGCRQPCAGRSADRWASADQPQAGNGANRLGGGESRGQRKQRQANGGNRRRSSTLT
jgi:hypothetical protein